MICDLMAGAEEVREMNSVPFFAKVPRVPG